MKLWAIHGGGRYAYALYIVAAKDCAEAEGFVSQHIGSSLCNPIRFTAGKAECIGNTKKPKGIVVMQEYIE